MAREEGVPLTLALRGEIGARLETLAGGRGEARLSEHAFANLYLFRAAHRYRYLAGPVPALAGRTYDGQRHLMPLGPLDGRAVDTLVARLGEGGCLYPLARWQLDALDPARFAWTAHPADADYLYPAANFRDYAGRALAPKRAQARRLCDAHAVEAVAFAPAHMGECLAILAGWMADKGKSAGEADERACRAALAHARTLGLSGFVHRVDGEPAGFVLAEEIEPGVFVMRFAKGRDRWPGLYPAMFRHFARRDDRPVAWMNFEQDLGLPNFRRAKRAFRPAALLEKFRAVPRRA